MLMCMRHWRMVPRIIQQQVWANYRPGQEVDKHPSEAYLVVQRVAVEAVARKEGMPIPWHPAGDDDHEDREPIMPGDYRYYDVRGRE